MILGITPVTWQRFILDIIRHSRVTNEFDSMAAMPDRLNAFMDQQRSHGFLQANDGSQITHLCTTPFAFSFGSTLLGIQQVFQNHSQQSALITERFPTPSEHIFLFNGSDQHLLFCRLLCDCRVDINQGGFNVSSGQLHCLTQLLIALLVSESCFTIASLCGPLTGRHFVCHCRRNTRTTPCELIGPRIKHSVIPVETTHKAGNNS